MGCEDPSTHAHNYPNSRAIWFGGVLAHYGVYMSRDGKELNFTPSLEGP
jgi:hypothetical protein